ncbi:ATP-binding protein [Burkholderia territorii]|uniref:ATP-binding protein n=1 Tax=Burkholderia territorii TaxID=1503055 RepID=UPI0009BD3582|nr:ATP-binding protein [Burkholderia territorii]
MKTRLSTLVAVWRLLYRALLGAMLVVSLPASAAPESTKPAFTKEELQWINAHPVVHIAVEANWHPIEYLRNGKHGGLVAGYLDAISRISGLSFKTVPGTQWGQADAALKSGRVDLLPGVWRELVHDRFGDGALVSMPYLVGRLTAVTRSDSTMIFSLHRLEGRRVAIKGNGAVEYFTRHSGVPLDVLTFDSEEDALAAVAAGEADAALGVDVTMLPIVRSRYLGQLFMSGMLADRPVSLAMITRTDMPLLASIIDKSLAAIPVSETAAMTRNWVELADYGKPTIRSILHYRAPQVIAIGLALLAFATLAYLSWKSRAAAVRSERDKAMFLGFISHEIRTPMQTVLSSLELLQCSSLTGQQASRADAAISASETLLTLLDDVLEFSRLESHKITLEPQAVALGAWARDTVSMVRWRADEKQIELALQVASPPSMQVVIDPVRLRQIALNLLVNAIKFTPAGSVTLRVDYLPGPQASRGTLVLEVRDTGVGISPESRQHMFDPYWQAGRLGQHGAQGSGLGLAICRQLVELMSGTIVVDSTPHVETTITVRLPVSAAVEPSAACAPPIASDSAVGQENADGKCEGESKPLILVIDDHEAVQYSICQQCDEIGCRTVSAQNGMAALQQLARTRFDMVLLDCNLPDIDGYALARMIRLNEATERAGRVPIIAISALSGDEHKVRCFDSGMDGVLGKPLRLAALRQMLAMWCPAYRDVTPDEPAALVPDNPSDLQAIYLQTIVHDFEMLFDAIRSDDVAGALHAAHRIKGASHTAGATRMAELAERIESQLREHPDVV